jgi:two-component system, sensor histidine kinase
MRNSRNQLRSGKPLEALALARRETHSVHFTINQALRNTFSVWIVTAFIMAAGWPQVSIWIALGWVGAVGAAFTLRTRYLQAARDLVVLEAAPEAWRFKLNSSTALCGVMAALGPALIFPKVDESAHLYVTAVYCSWLAGAMSSLGARPKLYASYALILVSGVAVGWFMVGAERRFEVCLMMLLFVSTTTSFSLNFAAQVNEGIEIRYANEQLVLSLQQAQIAAEESSTAKSRFLAVASHDLRQPLHAVTLLNGLLARPQTSEKINEISQQMGKSLASLERLFNSVLDFSKLEADKVQSDPAWHSLLKIFATLQASYATQAQGKGLALHFLEKDVLIHTDADLLERILRNLIENALKFTQHGSVTVAAVEGTQGLSIRIADTGPGIPAHLREEIFKEYFQAGAGKTGQGLGLGLAIVRRLSAILGLQVNLETGLTVSGCHFTVLVPRAMVRSSEQFQPDQELPATDTSLAGFYVAYVDDDAPSRDALGLLLSDWGCRVVTAETLESLMQKLPSDEVPDTLLTDFSLGLGMTGLDVIAAVRQRFGPVSAAILTGDVSAIDVEKLGELEYPVLRKPVPAQELRALLEVFKNIG